MELYLVNYRHTNNDLLKQLELYDNDVNKMLEQNKEQIGFIEAQLWSDKYLQDYL